MSFISNVDKFCVGHPQVDADHRMLAEYINTLHEVVTSGGTASEQAHWFGQLLERTRQHFLAEEQLMRAVNYPGYAKHKAEHDMLIEELQEMLLRFNAGSLTFNDSLFSYLEEWLLFHVVTTDQRLVDTALKPQ